MPPIVAAAAITGIATGATAIIGSRAQTGASRRAQAAQDAADRRAEAALKEDRDAEAARDAEDKRRWEVEQTNLVRRQAETDARTAYEDTIRYGKMVNLARLTGQPIPAPPPRAGDAMPASAAPSRARPATAPIMSRPSTANATITAPGAFPTSPLDVSQPQRMPISQLVGRRRVV